MAYLTCEPTMPSVRDNSSPFLNADYAAAVAAAAAVVADPIERVVVGGDRAVPAVAAVRAAALVLAGYPVIVGWSSPVKPSDYPGGPGCVVVVAGCFDRVARPVGVIFLRARICLLAVRLVFARARVHPE